VVDSVAEQRISTPVAVAMLAECWMGAGAFLSALTSPGYLCLRRPAFRCPSPWRSSQYVVVAAPVSRFLFLSDQAVISYMGSARGVGGVAMNTSLMECGAATSDGASAKCLLLRRNFLQLVLALAVGAIAHKVSL